MMPEIDYISPFLSGLNFLALSGFLKERCFSKPNELPENTEK